jgi:hypothetical protein
MSANPADPIDRLEIRAAQQRNQVHETIGELKDKVVAVRAKLDPNTNAREHLLVASLVLSSLGFLAGYGFGGLFTRN